MTKVFIPDESGMGGDEVELGKATFDMDTHRWLVWESQFKARLATEDEINLRRQEIERQYPMVWDGDYA